MIPEKGTPVYRDQKSLSPCIESIFDKPTPHHPFKNKAKKVLGFVGRGAFVALATISSINAAHITFKSGATEYEMSARIASPLDIDFDSKGGFFDRLTPQISLNSEDLAGYSQFDLGPGGRIVFDNFDAPAVATIQPVLRQPNSGELSSIAQNPQDEISRIYAPSAQDLEQSSNDLKDAIEYAGLAGATFGIISLLAIDALRKKSVREQLTKNILTPALVVGLLGMAMVHQVESTKDTQLQNPKFEGLVSLYPDIQRKITNTISNLDSVSEQAAGSISAVLGLLDSLNGIQYLGGREGITNVLYIANSECLPGVFETLQSLIDNGVHVDAVIIGGNMSLRNRDNAAEDFCVDGIEGFKDIPVFYTRGAADGPATSQRLHEMENVYPLDGYVREAAGLRLIGSDTPRTPTSMSPEDRFSEDAREFFAELAYGNNGHPFDIVAVNDIRSARDIIGRVPLILTASDEAGVEMIDGTTTLRVRSGNVGGGGLPALLDGGTSNQVAQVLSFRNTTANGNTKRLAAITRIDFQVRDSQLSLDVSTCPIPQEDFASC